MLATLLTLFIAGIIGIIAISIILAIAGSLLSMTFGLIAFLLFKVAPVLLIGWVVLKIVDRTRGRRRISTADQRWLDG